MSVVQPGRTRPAGWTRWLPGIATCESIRRAGSVAISERGWCSRLGLRLSESHMPSPPAFPAPAAYMRLSSLLLVYALFGPSRILVLGPGSSLAAIILGVVARSPPETQIARSLWPV
jgi:hypothetical protein